MLRLNIEQTYAKLELNITKPFLEIQTTAPQIQLETEAATVEISQPRGELEIDQYPSRASYGYQNFSDRTSRIAEEARQSVLEYIGRTAEEGDRLARIESGENAILAIIEEHAIPEPLEVGITPITPPYINYQVNPPQFNFIPGKVELNLQRGTIDLNLRRGTVEGRIAQYNSVRMWTTGSLDMRV